jgi:hypothetical protein
VNDYSKKKERKKERPFKAVLFKLLTYGHVVRTEQSLFS